MARILPFAGRPAAHAPGGDISALLDGFSIEVMPRTAAKVPDFREILPRGTRVYIAHLGDTRIEEMTSTAARLADEGFRAMPHVPARILRDRAMLDDWLRRYADAGVREALLVGGGVSTPAGDFDNTMQLLETGLFDRHGFGRLHVAGHPEGNRDIDPDGGDANVMAALRWKAAFADRTGAEMAIVTQFCFEAAPVIEWADRLRAEGIGLPIHIGVAGPAKLQTLIKFAMTCGVGPSVRVLTRRAADLGKLMLPFTPDALLAELARHKASHPDFNIRSVHVFPLGGIGKAAEYLDARRGTTRGAAARA